MWLELLIVFGVVAVIVMYVCALAGALRKGASPATAPSNDSGDPGATVVVDPYTHLLTGIGTPSWDSRPYSSHRPKISVEIRPGRGYRQKLIRRS